MFEYKQIYLGSLIKDGGITYDYIKMLNDAGKNEWELVCIVNNIAFLKKYVSPQINNQQS